MRPFLRTSPIDPEKFVDAVLDAQIIPELTPPSDFSEEQRQGWEEHRREVARVVLLDCTRRMTEKLTNPDTGELRANLTTREAMRIVGRSYNQLLGPICAGFLCEYSGGYEEKRKPQTVKGKGRGRPSRVFVFLSPDPPSYSDLAYILGPRGGKWEEWRRQVDEYRRAVTQMEREEARKVEEMPPALAFAI